MTIAQDAAGLEYGAVIELVQVDLTPFGGTVYRFYNSYNTGDALGEVTFLGVTWVPVPFESEGWGTNGSGSTPRPVITFSDYDAVFLAASIDYQDLIGARIEKYETTVEHLATGSYYGPEIWLVNQKIEANGYMMKIGLCTPMDMKTRKFPNREMWRDSFPGLSKNKF